MAVRQSRKQESRGEAPAPAGSLEWSGQKRVFIKIDLRVLMDVGYLIAAAKCGIPRGMMNRHNRQRPLRQMVAGC
jgi:hypothetical protein